MREQDVKRGDNQIAIKVGFWYVISSFMIKSMAFITTPIFARIMDTEAYGEFSNFVSWRSLLLIVVGLELYNTLPRAYYDYKNEFDEYASTITIFSGLVTCFFYIVFLIGKDFFLKFVAIPEAFIHILFVSLFFASFKSIYLTREKTLYRYRSAALISILDGIVPTLISILAVIMVADSAKLAARIYGFYTTSLITGIICGAILLYKGRRFNGRNCIYAIKLAIPLQVNYLTIYLLTNINTIVTKNITGASAAAVVSISVSVLHIMTVLFQAMNSAIMTWLMDKLEQKRSQEARREMMGYIAFLCVITIGTILFAPEIVFILGGEKYIEATILIPAMAVAALIQAVSSIFTIILTYDKKIVRTVIYMGIIAVASVVVKIILLPMFGIISLPYINLVASVIIFVINYILVRIAGYSSVIHLKGCFFTIGAVLLLMCFSYFLYGYMIIRYAIICLTLIAFIVVAIKNRAKIINLLRK